MTLAAPELAGRSGPQFSGVVARLAGVNGVLALVAMVTGPLLARVLGPDGRGELSAILTVFVLAPLVLDFGLADFVSRERARGTSAGTVLGTSMPFAFGFSLLGVLLAVPVAEVVGQGRPVVEQFVRIALFASPIFVFGWILVGLARGEQRWPILYRVRLINTVGGGFVIVALAAFGALTVQTAVIAAMTMSLVAVVASLPVLRNVGRWRPDRTLMGPALAFAARSWLIMLSTASNYRLDQVVMAAVVTSEQLGHYAVAVSLTAIVFGFVGAVNAALLPRVAQEGAQAVPRVVRVSVLVLTALLATLAATAPLMVPLIFGNEFQQSVVLVEILSLGALFFGVSWVLSGALQGYGRPQDAARPQVLGLAVTVLGLAVLLEPLGALGAALVSVVAYAAVFAATLRVSVRVFDTSPQSLLVPGVEDVRWLIAAARHRRKR